MLVGNTFLIKERNNSRRMNEIQKINLTIVQYFLVCVCVSEQQKIQIKTPPSAIKCFITKL